MEMGGGWGRLLTLTFEWNNNSASLFLHEYHLHHHWQGFSRQVYRPLCSQGWQSRWASHLNPLAHILLALPYLGLTAAEGNNVCQESVKLEPKPTLLFKSTSQVPTSLLIAKLTMSNTNKPANSIRTPLLWDSPGKKRLCEQIPLQLYTELFIMKKWPLFISFSVHARGKLAAELVSKTPWSEARDVWLKLGLLSVCHPDLTRGELFVGCVFSVCLCALRSAVTGDEPRHVAAGDREPFLLSNPDGASTWKTFHLSCRCLLSLPSSLSLSVDVKGYNRSSDTETERVNLSLLFPPLTFLFVILSLVLFPTSLSLLYRLLLWPAFPFLCSSNQPSLPLSGL